MAIPRQDHIEKIHDIAVEEAVGEITDNPTREQRCADAARGVQKASAPCHHGDRHECDRGEADEKPVVVLHHSKRRAGVVNLHEIKKSRNDLDGYMRRDVGEDQKFRDLVEDVERERQEQEESPVAEACEGLAISRGEEGLCVRGALLVRAALACLREPHRS